MFSCFIEQSGQDNLFFAHKNKIINLQKSGSPDLNRYVFDIKGYTNMKLYTYNTVHTCQWPKKSYFLKNILHVVYYAICSLGLVAEAAVPLTRCSQYS